MTLLEKYQKVMARANLFETIQKLKDTEKYVRLRGFENIAMQLAFMNDELIKSYMETKDIREQMSPEEIETVSKAAFKEE